MAEIKNIIDKLRRISTFYNKEVRIRFFKKKAEDEVNLLTTDDMAKFDNCDQTKRIKSWLKKPQYLKPQQHLIRPYLNIQYLIESPNRPGANFKAYSS